MNHIFKILLLCSLTLTLSNPFKEFDKSFLFYPSTSNLPNNWNIELKNEYIKGCIDSKKNSLTDSEIEDRNELCGFIRTITKSPRESEEQWVGDRAMVDMLEIGKRYYYDPLTNGSNSLKKVLPAVLNRSDFLKKNYSQPIYGAPGGITSLNFKDWRWIEFDGEKVKDPYDQLPPMFQDRPDEELVIMSEDDILAIVS